MNCSWRFLAVAALVGIALGVSRPLDAGMQDPAWPWRGPSGNGHAAQSERPPVEWSAEKNVIWRAAVPGRGHSSPIVAAGRVFLTTADEGARTQSVLAFDLASGERLWETRCNEGNFNPRIHPKNTHASPSVACDGQRVFAVFNHSGGVFAYALDLDGQLLWSRRVGSFRPTQYEFGFGQSPVIWDGKLIVAGESETDPFIAALDPASGEDVWRIRRPKVTSYGTPAIYDVGGRPVLFMSGAQQVTAYDPRDASQLWSTPADWVVCCGTMVCNADHSIAFASGGFPTQQTIAVRTDGSGKVWSNKVKCYEQSLIVVDECVYGLNENGILYCWDAATGKELWASRLAGPESPSPVFAGGLLYVTNERGRTWVFRPSREKADLVAVNELGTESFASPAFVGSRILLRHADIEGDERRETLYCIGMPGDETSR